MHLNGQSVGGWSYKEIVECNNSDMTRVSGWYDTKSTLVRQTSERKLDSYEYILSKRFCNVIKNSITNIGLLKDKLQLTNQHHATKTKPCTARLCSRAQSVPKGCSKSCQDSEINFFIPGLKSTFIYSNNREAWRIKTKENVCQAMQVPSQSALSQDRPRDSHLAVSYF